MGSVDGWVTWAKSAVKTVGAGSSKQRVTLVVAKNAQPAPIVSSQGLACRGRPLT